MGEVSFLGENPCRDAKESPAYHPNKIEYNLINETGVGKMVLAGINIGTLRKISNDAGLIPGVANETDNLRLQKDDGPGTEDISQDRFDMIITKK